MAFRARLVAPTIDERKHWPWHQVKRTIVRANQLCTGDRRMEAETYLSSGFGIRAAIEGRSGWVRFDKLAKPWAPPRIKQVFVAPEYGIPYLNTSQVFDIRPTPRKWLAFEKTSKAQIRLARQGTILVMASATPGRATLVAAAHENAFISHHFMRIDPVDEKLAGWVYAYLLSSQGRAMMTGSQYASIIRHIEPHHLAALPVPLIADEIADDFQARSKRIIALRNDAYRHAEEADRLFAQILGPLDVRESETGFEVRASTFASERRRFEAAYHAPTSAAIKALFKHWQPLSDVTTRVWWMSRFKRYYGEEGIPYVSADELFTVNPVNQKRILVNADDNHEEYFVKAGWIAMACSGQIYGLNGAAALMLPTNENTFFSHDIIRIIPDTKKIRAGYLLVALTHRTHGRPLLVRAAYGTSIPHLDPGDVAAFPVVRLSDNEEATIAGHAEAAARSRNEADDVERELATDASALIDQFIAQR